jgi:hypothetical protein
MGFFDDLLGITAKKAIQKGQRIALGDIGTGEAGALESFRSGTERLDPYATSGREAYDAYLASLGLRGDEARRGVQDIYFGDPVQNALMDRIARANTRRFTGIGMGNSGAATQSLTNALLANYGAYQDRLRGAGDTGFQAAGAQSGIDTQAGMTRFAAGQQRAGINLGAANAQAQASGIGINNLLGIAGTVAPPVRRTRLRPWLFRSFAFPRSNPRPTRFWTSGRSTPHSTRAGGPRSSTRASVWTPAAPPWRKSLGAGASVWKASASASRARAHV